VGSQALRWTYSKNGRTTVGLDRAWVAQVAYEPMPVPQEPGSLAETPVFDNPTVTDASVNSSSQNQVLTVTVPAPFTASGPEDEAVTLGSNVRLAVSVTSPGPLTYVCRFNSNVIAGAISAELILENFVPEAAGRYCFEITGRCQPLTNCATITVFGP
jgi:hypothetical protein